MTQKRDPERSYRYRRFIRELLNEGFHVQPRVLTVCCPGRYKLSELLPPGVLVDCPITDERFPIRKHAPVTRVLEMVHLDHPTTSREVRAEFVHRGLEWPTIEDALCILLTYPEEPQQPTVFLWYPTVRVGNYRCVLVIRRDADGVLCIELERAGREWPAICVFPGVVRGVRQ